MRLAALFSGGKDSVMAVWDSISKGHEVRYLVTMMPQNPESYMFHYPNVEFAGEQAKSMGIRHIAMPTKGEKEKELDDLLNAMKPIKGEVDAITAGGLASNYQRNRIRAIADSLGLQMLAPYWKIRPDRYWGLILSNGFRVMVTGVACEGLGKEWLGRVVDARAYRELKKLAERHRFHLAGEGGEFETFVLDGPVFRKRLEVTKGEAVWDRDSGFYIIKGLKSVTKEGGG